MFSIFKSWFVKKYNTPLVRALTDYLKCSDDELESMGKRGRNLVEEKYASEAVAKQFFEMYMNLCQKK